MRNVSALVFAATAALVLSASPASAAGASDTLAVGVTVAPSCSVTAQAIDQRSPSVHLSCSSAQRSLVMMGNNLIDGKLAAPGGQIQVGSQSKPASSGEPSTVTLNF